MIGVICVLVKESHEAALKYTNSGSSFLLPLIKDTTVTDTVPAHSRSHINSSCVNIISLIIHLGVVLP